MLVSEKQLRHETNQGPSAHEKIMKGNGEQAKAPVGKPDLERITKDNIIGEDINLEKRKQMIAAKGFEPVEFAFERAIGANDSLYSNFTELIALTKRKVGRIVLIEDGRRVGFATGFMVSPELMLTNWHVFKAREMAEESEVHFFYEYDVQGHPLTPVIFRFNTNRFFFSDEELDYSLVAVQSMDVDGKFPLTNISYLYLDKSLGKIGEVNKEKLNIIHHPQGDYKQISIRENTFTGIEPTKIFYETDTAQGSSGSPVFNDQWQVVGLHHKSIAKMTPDGLNYLDKNDKVIPVIDDKVDASCIVWLRNEGIRISVILKHVTEKFPANELVRAINIPPKTENLSFSLSNGTVRTSETIPSNTNTFNETNITLSIPAASIPIGKTVDFSFTSRELGERTSQGDKKLVMGESSRVDELLLEVAKADKEKAVDFNGCKGYDPMFLGVNIPLPQPNKALEKKLARLKNKSTELKYYKYSVLFNTATKMPALSAVNVEGDAAKRKDDSKRSDDWLRDKRIDIDCQLTDKFYSRSHFDKGHMSRFEDANWDNTVQEANRNGVFTCFYTNACPQVVALNRAGGLWGQLEKAVLEKGIKKEAGKLARMTVMNGPIFDADKDRLFKGVTIPMSFFKLILWLNDKGKLRATAFKLSQEALVDDIQFDESMRIEEEALDIDKDVKFTHYQCSLQSLGKSTGLDFSHLKKYDTFKAVHGNEEVKLEGEEALML